MCEQRQWKIKIIVKIQNGLWINCQSKNVYIRNRSTKNCHFKKKNVVESQFGFMHGYLMQFEIAVEKLLQLHWQKKENMIKQLLD